MKYDQFLLDVRHDGEIYAELSTVEGNSPNAMGEIILDERLHDYVTNDIKQLYSVGLDEAGLKRLGKALYETLFPLDIGKLFEQAEEEEKKRFNEGVKDRRLRLIIRIDHRNKEVLTWPLEFLYYPSSGFLATKKYITLSRQIAFGRLDIDKKSFDPPLKVLVVVSQPKHLGAVMGDTVMEDIIQFATTVSQAQPVVSASVGDKLKLDTFIEVKVLGTTESNESAPPNVEYIAKKATFTEIGHIASQWTPHVLHFIGHGKLENNQSWLGLIKDEDDPEVDWCSGETFCELFSDWRPRMVVLQACRSAEPATGAGFMSLAAYLVERSISAVVAMQFEIQNRFAVKFAEGFYESLAQGLEIDTAVQDGRWKIPIEGNIAWKERHFGAPVLFMLTPMNIIQPITTVAQQYQERHQPGTSMTLPPSSIEAKIQSMREQAQMWISQGEDALAASLLQRIDQLKKDLLAQGKKPPEF